jgi:hypothetical protein
MDMVGTAEHAVQEAVPGKTAQRDRRARNHQFGRLRALLGRAARAADDGATPSRYPAVIAELAQLKIDASIFGVRPVVLDALDLVEDALDLDPPATEVAEQLLNGIRHIVPSRSSIRQVTLGILVSIAYFVAFFLFLIYGSYDTTAGLMGQNVQKLGWIAAIGGAGGIASMLFRFRDFAHLADTDAFVQMLIGAVRPAISGAFAVFVYFVLNSGATGVGFVADGIKGEALQAVVAFIAGFSERWAPSLLDQTAKAVGASRQD